MAATRNLRILMITSEWPTIEQPYCVPFIVRQVKFLRRSGIHVDVFHFHGKKNPLLYVKARHKLRKYCMGKTYDLIHAQWGQSAFLAIPKQLPLVVTFRGSDLEGIVQTNGHYGLSGKLLGMGSRFVSLAADQVILVSDHLGRKISKNFYQVIPSGLDLDLFRPMEKQEIRNKLGLDPQQKIVFFGGDPKVNSKRYWLAEKAVEQIKADYPDLTLFAPHSIPHRKIPAYLNASDVLLLTSMHEGSPNVVKEALACNVPVVSTDVGDVRERIEKIVGCVVCKDDQPETIASALKRVLMRERRIEGRSSVLDLDENLLTQRLIATYEQALNHARA